MASYVTVHSAPEERFTQIIESGSHRMLADKQLSSGGSDQGPGPYAFLLAALGS
jgi:putative redox protein